MPSSTDNCASCLRALFDSEELSPNSNLHILLNTHNPLRFRLVYTSLITHLIHNGYHILVAIAKELVDELTSFLECILVDDGQLSVTRIVTLDQHIELPSASKTFVLLIDDRRHKRITDVSQFSTWPLLLVADYEQLPRDQIPVAAINLVLRSISDDDLSFACTCQQSENVSFHRFLNRESRIFTGTEYMTQEECSHTMNQLLEYIHESLRKNPVPSDRVISKYRKMLRSAACAFVFSLLHSRSHTGDMLTFIMQSEWKHFIPHHIVLRLQAHEEERKISMSIRALKVLLQQEVIPHVSVFSQSPSVKNQLLVVFASLSDAQHFYNDVAQEGKCILLEMDDRASYVTFCTSEGKRTLTGDQKLSLLLTHPSTVIITDEQTLACASKQLDNVVRIFTVNLPKDKRLPSILNRKILTMQASLMTINSEEWIERVKDENNSSFDPPASTSDNAPMMSFPRVDEQVPSKEDQWHLDKNEHFSPPQKYISEISSAAFHERSPQKRPSFLSDPSPGNVVIEKATPPSKPRPFIQDNFSSEREEIFRQAQSSFAAEKSPSEAFNFLQSSRNPQADIERPSLSSSSRRFYTPPSEEMSPSQHQAKKQRTFSRFLRQFECQTSVGRRRKSGSRFPSKYQESGLHQWVSRR
mmetsp:Transcript_2564/g.9762  ORF Transcript_2564/g.9762 Transcript_2564/m.9762 type:complete len:641 (-) Transcript_2564:62-1984(-)